MLAGGQRPGGVEAARVSARRSVRRSVVLPGPAPGFGKPAVPRHQGLEWIIRDAEPLLCCRSGASLHQDGQGQAARSLEEVTALNPHAATLFGLCFSGRAISARRRQTRGWLRSPQQAQRRAGWQQRVGLLRLHWHWRCPPPPREPRERLAQRSPVPRRRHRPEWRPSGCAPAARRGNQR